MKRGILRYLVLVPLGMATAGLGMYGAVVTLIGIVGLGAGQGSSDENPVTIGGGLVIIGLAVLCCWVFRKLLPLPPSKS